MKINKAAIRRQQAYRKQIALEQFKARIRTVQFMGAEIEVSGAADEAEARDIAFAWLADQEDA
jgi:hypothetical protein